MDTSLFGQAVNRWRSPGSVCQVIVKALSVQDRGLSFTFEWSWHFVGAHLPGPLSIHGISPGLLFRWFPLSGRLGVLKRLPGGLRCWSSVSLSYSNAALQRDFSSLSLSPSLPHWFSRPKPSLHAFKWVLYYEVLFPSAFDLSCGVTRWVDVAATVRCDRVNFGVPGWHIMRVGGVGYSWENITFILQ